MADTIPDGYYWIRSADDVGKAMDVLGGADLAGVDIQYWDFNGQDAQLASVRNLGDGVVTICFPLTGMYVDANDAGARPIGNGSRVSTWDGDAARPQQFLPVATGETATIDGKPYPSYRLRSMGLKASGDAKNYCLDGSGTSTASGTVIFLWEEYDGGKQAWCFVPVAMPPLGTYKLHPMSNPELVMDVWSSSAQVGANVQVYPEGDQNNQRFSIHEGKAGDDLVAIANVASGLYVDVEAQDDEIRGGLNVQMYVGDGSGGQNFGLVPAGQARVNGALVDCVEIAPKAGTGWRLDVGGGGDTPEDNVQVWEANGTPFQRWALVPDEAEATDVPAPHGVHLMSGGNRLGKVAGTRGPATLHGAWSCEGDAWKERLRRRLRKAGGAWGAWGGFVDARLGSSANQGWGQMWAPTESTAASYDVTSSLPIECPVDNESYDACEVEFEVRRFLEAWGKPGQEGPAHTASGTARTLVAWRPSITLTAVGFGPQGLVVGYQTDSKRDGHALALSSALFQAVTVERAARSGSVAVPMGSLRSIPRDGQAVSVSARLTTTDGLTSDASLSGTVSYDAGSGMSLSPKYTRDDTLLGWRASCAGATGCWVEVASPTGETEFRECPKAGPSWLILPPLGSRAHVFWAGKSGSAWAVRDDWLDAIEAPEHVWVWGERCLRALVDEGEPPTASRSLKADSEEHLASGTRLPQVGFGMGVAADCSLSCSLIDGAGRDLAADLLLARELAASGSGPEKVVYRDPWGFWASVAVTSVDMPRQFKAHCRLTVTQEAIRD